MVPRLAQLTRRDLIAGSSLAGATGVAIALGITSTRGTGHGDRTVQFHTDSDHSVASTPQSTTAITGATPPGREPEQKLASPTVEASAPIDPATVLADASIADLLDGMASGAFTAEQLVQAVLDRIETYDRQGPQLGAVIETVPDVLDRARAADCARAAGDALGPLHGIPVLVKDIIATDDGSHTTAGSFALEDNVVSKDAFLVTQLRNAGAIIVGKANLSEWSNFKGDGGAAGYSPRGGQTRNPYNPELSPSGSSSGSAVSVSAGYVPAAIGAETNGSIISPAAFCGVVGFKPTAGLVSRSGLIPISLSQDSPGPLTRSVTDAALVLSVLAGFDPADPLNGELADFAPAAAFDESPIPAPGATDYLTALDADALQGARIGTYGRLFGFDERVDAIVNATLELMAQAGAEIVNDIEAGSFDELEAFDRFPIFATEFRAGFDAWCATYAPGGPVATMADVVAYNTSHPDQELAVSDQWALEDVANTTMTLEDPEYREMLAAHTTLARRDGIDLIMDQSKVEVLVAPSAGLPGKIDHVDEGYAGSSSGFAAFAGYPSLTIPIGEVDGLPVGLNFFGRAFSEATLLAIAYATEQLLPQRPVPQLDTPTSQI